MTEQLLLIDSARNAAQALKPLRINILRFAIEPRTCSELADLVGASPQKVYYHVKRLEEAGLVERVSERVVNGLCEGRYQARARAFWVSPSVFGDEGRSARMRDEASLGILIEHGGRMIDDVGRLANRTRQGERIPSLSLMGEVELPTTERRNEFMEEIRQAFEDIASRYSLPPTGAMRPDQPAPFRFTLACYPLMED